MKNGSFDETKYNNCEYNICDCFGLGGDVVIVLSEALYLASLVSRYRQNQNKNNNYRYHPSEDRTYDKWWRCNFERRRWWPIDVSHSDSVTLLSQERRCLLVRLILQRTV